MIDNYNFQLATKGYVKIEMADFCRIHNDVNIRKFINDNQLNQCDALNHNYVYLFPDPPLTTEGTRSVAIWDYLYQIIRKEFLLLQLNSIS